MQQRHGLFDHPAVYAEAGAVFGAASGDVGCDALAFDLLAVDVVVIGAVGVEAVWAPAGSAAFAAYRRDGVDQWE